MSSKISGRQLEQSDSSRPARRGSPHTRNEITQRALGRVLGRAARNPPLPSDRGHRQGWGDEEFETMQSRAATGTKIQAGAHGLERGELSRLVHRRAARRPRARVARCARVTNKMNPSSAFVRMRRAGAFWQVCHVHCGLLALPERSVQRNSGQKKGPWNRAGAQLQGPADYSAVW